MKASEGTIDPMEHQMRIQHRAFGGDRREDTAWIGVARGRAADEHVGAPSTIARLLSSALSLGLVVAPLTSPRIAHAAVENTDDADLKNRVRALFGEALTAYGLADYDTAIDKLTEAYKLAQQIDDPAARFNAMLNLQFNLAKAHVEAYTIDAKISHLKIAKNLLNKQLAVEELSEEDRNIAASLMARIDAYLEASQAKADADAAAAKKAEEEAAAVEEEASAAEETAARPSTEASPSQDDRRDKGRDMSPLKLGGIISLAGAGAGLGIMAAGFAIAGSAQDAYDNALFKSDMDAAQKRGNTGNLLTIAGGATAVALGAAGAALLVIDMKRKKSGVAVLPTWSPDTLGMMVGGRF